MQTASTKKARINK